MNRREKYSAKLAVIVLPFPYFFMFLIRSKRERRYYQSYLVFECAIIVSEAYETFVYNVYTSYLVGKSFLESGFSTFKSSLRSHQNLIHLKKICLSFAS